MILVRRDPIRTGGRPYPVKAGIIQVVPWFGQVALKRGCEQTHDAPNCNEDGEPESQCLVEQNWGNPSDKKDCRYLRERDSENR